MATEIGIYAVEITNQSFTVVSECVEIINVGILNPTDEMNISVFPNPFTSALQPQSIDFNGNTTFGIYNLKSQMVQSTNHNCQSTIILNLNNRNKGIYLLKITTDNKQHIQPLIKH